MIKADSTEQGLKLAEEMVAFDGLGHSAAIHTADEELVKNVRLPRQSAACDLEFAFHLRRHRRRVQRLPAFSDPRLRLLR